MMILKSYYVDSLTIIMQFGWSKFYFYFWRIVLNLHIVAHMSKQARYELSGSVENLFFINIIIIIGKRINK